MGAFDFSTPNHQVYTMSSRHVSTGRFIPFRMSYFDDMWTLPSPNLSCEGHLQAGMSMSLSAIKFVYQDVIDSSTDPYLVPSPMDEEDIMSKTIWATSLSYSHDFLDGNFPSDEAIIEAMNGSKKTYDDMHHRTYFLPELERIKQDDFRYTLSEIVIHAVVLLDTNDIDVEGNMASIYPTIQINISHTPCKVENINISVDCFPEEI